MRTSLSKVCHAAQKRARSTEISCQKPVSRPQADQAGISAQPNALMRRSLTSFFKGGSVGGPCVAAGVTFGVVLDGFRDWGDVCGFWCGFADALIIPVRSCFVGACEE